MYAIIRTGGKQYTVKPGDVLKVEKLEQDLGAEFDIADVVMVGGEQTHVGQPLVKNAKVTVVVTKQGRGRKIAVFKKKRRHSYRKFQNHKQSFTEIFVKAITSPDGKSAKSDAQPKVVDIAASRVERIKSKQAAAQARRENKGEPVEPKKAKPAKKVAKKAAGKKTTKTAKKASGKKAAKKTKKA